MKPVADTHGHVVRRITHDMMSRYENGAVAPLDDLTAPVSRGPVAADHDAQHGVKFESRHVDIIVRIMGRCRAVRADALPEAGENAGKEHHAGQNGDAIRGVR